MSTPCEHRWILRGASASVAAATDRLILTTELRGAVELEVAAGRAAVDLVFAIAADAAVPQLTDLADLTVEVLPPPDHDAVPITGFEADEVIWITSDLLVRPPWVAQVESFQGIELLVPRGMAFGSGEHGSTKAALTLLHELLGPAAVRPRPATVVDVGCGSGILLGYAAQRGVPTLLGCDVELAAVRATQALVPSADVRLGDPAHLPAAVGDLVIANHDARQLGAALPAIVAVWNRRHALILGGMRPHEVASVLAGGADLGRLDGECRCDGWVAQRYVAGA